LVDGDLEDQRRQVMPRPEPVRLQQIETVDHDAPEPAPDALRQRRQDRPTRAHGRARHQKDSRQHAVKEKAVEERRRRAAFRLPPRNRRKRPRHARDKVIRQHHHRGQRPQHDHRHGVLIHRLPADPPRALSVRRSLGEGGAAHFCPLRFH